MLDICIMGLLRMRMDALHYALLAVVVLMAVYCGSSVFREASTPKDSHDERGDINLRIGVGIRSSISEGI